MLAASWMHVVALRSEPRGQFDGFTSHVRAELAALSPARQAGPIPDTFKPDAIRAPDAAAGLYFAGVDDLGDPVLAVSTVKTSFDGPRQSADAVFFGALGTSVRPTADPDLGETPPVVVEGAPRAGDGSCVIVPAGRRAVMQLPSGGLVVRTPGPGRATVGVGGAARTCRPTAWIRRCRRRCASPASARRSRCPSGVAPRYTRAASERRRTGRRYGEPALRRAGGPAWPDRDALVRARVGA